MAKKPRFSQQMTEINGKKSVIKLKIFPLFQLPKKRESKKKSLEYMMAHAVDQLVSTKPTRPSLEESEIGRKREESRGAVGVT
jgi:hypothetical protein